MRVLAAAMLALLAACSGAKPADTTATYGREAPNGPVVVRAAANGDARVEAGENLFIRKSGADYVVLRDGQGAFSVRRDDLLAYFAELDKAANLFPGGRVQPEYVMRAEGSETVAGQSGRVWKVHPSDIPSLPAAEAVISSDPALGPMGRALAMQTNFSILRNSGMSGGPGNLEKAMMALFDKGAVLRFGTALRLQRLYHAPIPPGMFDPPRPLLDAAGLRRRMAAERARLAQPGG